MMGRRHTQSYLESRHVEREPSRHGLFLARHAKWRTK